MRFWMKSATLAMLLAAGAGCTTTKLLDARFEQSGTPAGTLPGSPTGDSVSVDNSTVPEEDGGYLYWRPLPHGKARFRSATYSNPDSTKTIYWEGRRTSGPTDFVFQIGAEDASGAAPQVPFTITLGNGTVSANGYVGPVTTRNFNADEEHTIFVSLRVATGKYYIKLTRPSAAAVEIEGVLDAATVNRLKSQSRLVMQAGFADVPTAPRYRMDKLIMRQKN